MYPTLLITGLILAGIAYLLIKIKEAISLRKFRKEIAPIFPLVEQQLELFEDTFVPSRIVTDEEVDKLAKDNEGLLNSVNALYTPNKSIYNDYLDTTSIMSYRIEASPHALKERQKKNNTLVDILGQVNLQTSAAIQQFSELTEDSHYFAFSEMQDYIQAVNDIDGLVKKVPSKYGSYITDDIRALKDTRNRLESIRKEHNQSFIQRELKTNMYYFDTVLGTYPLDEQQRDSLVKLEDNCLVIASAGSGKTSTILAKAKYLVEKRNIDPAKILLITYTRKAANELHERMNFDGMTCCTFHALAYKIISLVTGQTPTICDSDLTLNVFHQLIESNKDFLHAVNNYIINQQSLMGLEHDYTEAFSYFEDRKKYGIQALFRDVDGKMIFTRSEEEKRLVSLLTRLGVPFRYENAYEYNTTTPERRQYRPDFTIYYLDRHGQWRWLYLEHFGIDAKGNVPLWFGEGERGGWNMANQKYREGIEWKRKTHRQHKTILIETTSADFRNGTVESKLRKQLERYGVPIKERTDEELYELLVKRNKKLEKSIYTLILSFVTLMKANEKDIDGLLKGMETTDDITDINPALQRNKTILANIIKPFYEEYEQTLKRKYEIDFTDAIIEATELCRKGLWRHYDYILVDEFQDISVDRYKFLQALRGENHKTKLFCVGDDWQSIFRFAGSDMSLFYEFEKYFGYTEQCKIETTYRFHQPLIDESSKFIIKNKEQKVKTIRPPKGDWEKTFLHFVKCDEEDGVLKEAEKIVRHIPEYQTILFLGRYNYDAVSLGYKGTNFSDNRMMVKVCEREIPFLSVHSAKGLEADNVILVNCNQGAYGFPALIEDDPILDFVLSKNEAYPFAEERRLFYVAMTRAKMNMYVLYDQKKPSPFIGEFLVNLEKGSHLCPKCLEGKMVAIKDGVTTNGHQYRSFVCSNRDGGCNFFETRYGDLTPPGILISEDMTAQDIERLREERRRLRKNSIPDSTSAL